MAVKQNSIQSWAQRQTEPALNAGFSLFTSYSATTVPQKYVTYKPPRIVKTKSRWYVEYWYRIPENLKKDYNNKRWYRFRVFAEINRYKNNEYAELLCQSVEQALKSGFNPFQEDEPAEILKIASWSLNNALDKFLEYSQRKGLRKKTIQSYSIMVNFLKDYFLKDNLIFKPLSFFTKQHVRDFLETYRIKKKWNSHTYNNYLSYLVTIFNFFLREDKIDKSPVIGIEVLPVTITKHRYYDDETAAKLKSLMLLENPYLYEFCSFIYYTALRPKSEARLLQVKHILFDRNLLFIPAHISKNKKDDYIPLGKEVLELLSDRKYQDKEHYIFGGVKPHSQNHMATLYKPFKNAVGLNEDWSIYSWKYTRGVDLAKAGINPYELMTLFRHSSLEMTMRYLKNLGIVDVSGIEAKSRKF